MGSGEPLGPLLELKRQPFGIECIACEADDRTVGVLNLDGLDEVALVVSLHEVHDHFGVGLGRELVPVRLQRALQLTEVLDDPVQDDGGLALLAARQRVRVLLGDPSVGSPASVAEPGRALGAVVLRDPLQVREIPDRPDVVEPVCFEQCEPGRVIAPVLEALKAMNEERLRSPRPDISDDSTHPELLSPGASGNAGRRP